MMEQENGLRNGMNHTDEWDVKQHGTWNISSQNRIQAFPRSLTHLANLFEWIYSLSLQIQQHHLE